LDGVTVAELTLQVHPAEPQAAAVHDRSVRAAEVANPCNRGAHFDDAVVSGHARVVLYAYCAVGGAPEQRGGGRFRLEDTPVGATRATFDGDAAAHGWVRNVS
jgi:hypothetical protein